MTVTPIRPLCLDCQIPLGRFEDKLCEQCRQWHLVAASVAQTKKLLEKPPGGR